MRFAAALIGIIIALSSSLAWAQVHVRGYTRSDGTYVRPHIRSAPDNSLANNYGPSRSSPLYSPSLPDLSVVTPGSRDHDRDGLANMYDGDDDNDGIGDNYDPTQYGVIGDRYPSQRQFSAAQIQIRQSVAIDIYNRTLASARSDGVVTDSERDFLESMRRVYGLDR